MCRRALVARLVRCFLVALVALVWVVTVTVRWWMAPVPSALSVWVMALSARVELSAAVAGDVAASVVVAMASSAVAAMRPMVFLMITFPLVCAAARRSEPVCRCAGSAYVTDCDRLGPPPRRSGAFPRTVRRCQRSIPVRAGSRRAMSQLSVLDGRSASGVGQSSD